MWWFWKLLGYKDEEKEMIKQYQLEKAKEHFKEQLNKDDNLSQKQKEQKKGWAKSYAEAVKKKGAEAEKK
jgi:hypothetical protein